MNIFQHFSQTLNGGLLNSLKIINFDGKKNNLFHKIEKKL